MTTIINNLLAFGILFSSVISITAKNPVISIIFLITAFVNAAGFLILIGINFIGISYIVIYVGAIAVLFLFIILMINIKLTDILETGNSYTKNLPIALIITTLFLYIFNVIMPNTFNNVPILSFNFINTLNNATLLNDNYLSLTNTFYSTITSEKHLVDAIITDFQQMEVLGHSLYTYQAIFLIILSIILLLAMVAIIVISKNNKNI